MTYRETDRQRETKWRTEGQTDRERETKWRTEGQTDRDIHRQTAVVTSTNTPTV